MSYKDQLKGDSVSWLLEMDDPGIRYPAMHDLLDLPGDDIRLLEARQAAHQTGPIAEVLDHMEPEGYWMQPGSGYNPKYRSTVWSLILLAQLGASLEENPRIEKACLYMLAHGLTENGQFTSSTGPGGTIDCLQGNMLWSLLELGCTDPRLENAADWAARSVTGEGIAPMGDKETKERYYTGKCGPDFACGGNGKLPCAWGAAKVLLALGRLPQSMRTPSVERAITRGIDFFLGVDPVTAAYPTGYADKPSGNWWKFGFPIFYVTDLLQVAEAMVQLGLGRDPRMQGLLDLVLSKQDEQGRWALEHDYTGKTWIEVGAKKAPNKWVTLRALRVLKKMDESN